MKNNKVKYTYKSPFLGIHIEYLENQDIITYNDKKEPKRITKNELIEKANKHKGKDRIYIPVELCFWLDCNDGKHQNYLTLSN